VNINKCTLRTVIVSMMSASLISCGGGGEESGPATNTNTTTKLPTFSLSTPGGSLCASSFSDTDAFGNIHFQPSTGNTQWGCLVVDQSGNQPVVNGTKSVRFELRPGDCDSSQAFLSGTTVVSDCTSDRSRFEIRQNAAGATAGQIITYEYQLYIPAQTNFQPPWNNIGSRPMTILTQINWQCGANPCPDLGNGGYGALAYLLMDSTGALSIQTFQDFSWATNNKVTVDNSAFDKWIKLKYVIKSTKVGDGYFQVYANDAMIINETRATLPNLSAYNTLKLGIYNSSVSTVTKPWSTQVIYFDAFNTAVQNF
jgi:hypothetical protein